MIIVGNCTICRTPICICEDCLKKSNGVCVDCTERVKSHHEKLNPPVKPKDDSLGSKVDRIFRDGPQPLMRMAGHEKDAGN